MYHVEYCYKNGNLKDALAVAIGFISALKHEDNVVSVLSSYEVERGWTVLVTYET